MSNSESNQTSIQAVRDKCVLEIDGETLPVSVVAIRSTDLLTLVEAVEAQHALDQVNTLNHEEHARALMRKRLAFRHLDFTEDERG